MKIGDIEVSSVIDGSIVSWLPATKALPDPSSVEWQDQHGMFRPDGMKESTVGGFLIKSGERVVLVDAGSGQQLDRPYAAPAMDLDDSNDPMVRILEGQGIPEEHFEGFADHLRRTQLIQGRLPVSLSALGVRPEQVTDVIFTHLHFDHIGWASAAGEPFFPNATFRCAAADLHYFLSGAAEEWYTCYVYQAMTARDRLGPVLDRIETWESDGPILAGVDVRLAPGHTPGSSVVVISDGPERAMVLGDIVHCPLELMEDDFNLLVDHDQKLANQVRESFARELEGTDVRVAASHFPGLRFGRLLPGEGVRRFVFAGD